jgi:Ca2+-binding RTX toxin-like protein
MSGLRCAWLAVATMCSTTLIGTGLTAAASLAVAGPAATHRCFGSEPTIVASDFTDVIRGTAGPDVIIGPARRILGGGGDDLICNWVEGSQVAYVYGERGDDRIRGGRFLAGGAGDDVVISDGGEVVGLVDGPGDDVLRGGTSPDEFLVRGGADVVIGSTGPCAGLFTCDVLRVTYAAHVDLAEGTIEGPRSTKRVENIHTIFMRPARRGDHPSVVLGTAGDDYIFGARAGDVLGGRGGDDHLIGGLGDDRLRGAAGDDVLQGFGDVDTLRGGPGDDGLNGGSGKQDTCIDTLGANIFHDCERGTR